VGEHERGPHLGPGGLSSGLKALALLQNVTGLVGLKKRKREKEREREKDG